MNPNPCVIRFLFIVLLALSPKVVQAQTDRCDRWYDDYSRESLEQAEKLYNQGRNLYYEDYDFAQAIDTLKSALNYSESPFIYLTLARAYEKNNNLIAAHQSLLKALRWGWCFDWPDDSWPDDSREAKNLRDRLQSRLGFIQVECDDTADEIYINGAKSSECPGRITEPVLPGEHTMTVTKPGFHTRTGTFDVRAGMTAISSAWLQPVTPPPPRWNKRRLRILTGAGFLVGAAGVGITVHAYNLYKDFDNREDSEVPAPPSALARAKLMEGIGIGSMLAGGAAMIVGGTLLGLNGPIVSHDNTKNKIHLKFMPTFDIRGAQVRVQF